MDRAVMPWRRIALEGFVIVVSILLAFAIDAWWEGRKEQARLHALVQALGTDFEITRERLASSIERGDALVARTAGFLSLKGSHEVPPLDSVRFLAQATVQPIEFEPATATFEAAVQSGDIDLIESSDFITAAADFRQAQRWLQAHTGILEYNYYQGPTKTLRDRLGSVGAMLFAREGCPTDRWPVICAYPEEWELSAQQMVSLLEDRTLYSGFETAGNIQVNIVAGLREMDAAAARVLESLGEVR